MRRLAKFRGVDGPLLLMVLGQIDRLRHGWGWAEVGSTRQPTVADFIW